MTGTNAEQYRQYWATLTGRNPRDVYVPAALREDYDYDEPRDNELDELLASAKERLVVLELDGDEDLV